jgi:formylglycine-generating enzyme required for sulfatase activity
VSDIFLSYAREDHERALPVVTALRELGWEVWWDPTILPGETWDQVIEEALDGARCVVVLWSRVSVQKHWVRTEAAEGHRRGILVPALLDEVRIPLAFRAIQAASLIGWSGAQPHAEFEKLARAVSKVLGAAAPRARAAVVAASETPVVVLPGAAVGEVRKNPIDGLGYVWIPPGTFQMGCSPGDTECYEDEKPPKQVTIAKGFWLGESPVTQAAYEKVTRQNPSYFKGPDLPVEQVTWDEALAYCRAVGGRLPTDAEWEYAARAGTTGSRYGELDRIAWYQSNSGGKTHPVKQKQPNAWGLYDMLGNVWEWVEDLYPGTQKRTLRGGSWNNDPGYARASNRGRGVPSGRGSYFGFRCAWE